MVSISDFGSKFSHYDLMICVRQSMAGSSDQHPDRGITMFYQVVPSVQSNIEADMVNGYIPRVWYPGNFYLISAKGKTAILLLNKLFRQ
jgi:hypothetical protein